MVGLTTRQTAWRLFWKNHSKIMPSRVVSSFCTTPQMQITALQKPFDAIKYFMEPEPKRPLQIPKFFLAMHQTSPNFLAVLAQSTFVPWEVTSFTRWNLALIFRRVGSALKKSGWVSIPGGLFCGIGIWHWLSKQCTFLPQCWQADKNGISRASDSIFGHTVEM